MMAQFRAELLKLRTTSTNLGLLAASLALVLLVVALHGLALPVKDLGARSFQLKELFGRGETLGALFAALLGAMAVTGEFRHGTIRPTFLVNPRRAEVLKAKLLASMLAGAGFGLIAAAVAIVAGSVILHARGAQLQLNGGDHALLLVGSAAAAALWGAIGVGVGALIRNQVPALIGLCAWLLFVEGLLVGDSGTLGDVGRFLPGALGAAISGQEPLVAPVLAALVLALYVVAAAAAGSVSMSRRDVA